ASPETANPNHKQTAGSITFFMSDDECDAAVGQLLRLPGKAGGPPALQFVTPCFAFVIATDFIFATTSPSSSGWDHDQGGVTRGGAPAPVRVDCFESAKICAICG